ncbi:TPA: hypothetical protein N0F65_002219 [Lagenidium giganteum]|uniref:Uncharacterized protein n=1 Tax=Lagenidium giganteum TaxID=4803 RepID=A0AAV2YUB6_9STRA|nr:TPA: hypothetical protein N0F65_002219 [Lagenidium giganteum]
MFSQKRPNVLKTDNFVPAHAASISGPEVHHRDVKEVLPDQSGDKRPPVQTLSLRSVRRGCNLPADCGSTRGYREQKKFYVESTTCMVSRLKLVCCQTGMQSASPIMSLPWSTTRRCSTGTSTFTNLSFESKLMSRGSPNFQKNKTFGRSWRIKGNRALLTTCAVSAHTRIPPTATCRWSRRNSTMNLQRTALLSRTSLAD